MQNESKKDILKTITRYAQAGEWNKVITEYQKLIAMDPADANIQNSLADAYSKIGEERKAFEIYVRLLEDNQKRAQYAKVSSLYKKISKLDSKRFDVEGKALHEKIAKVVEAQSYYDKEDWDMAITAMKEALRLDPFNMDLLAKLGDVCERKLMIGEAVEQFVKILRILIERGHKDEAAGVAEKILTLDKSNVDAKALLAEIMIAKGEKEKGEEVFKEILLLMKEKQFLADGKQFSKKAMEAGMSLGREYYAYFLYRENKFEDAKKILEGQAGLTEAESIMLGKTYFKLEQYDRARETYFSLNPEAIEKHSETLEQVGDIFLKLREYKKASDYYMKGFRLLSVDPAGLDKAMMIANKVINVDSDNLELHEGLINIYIKKGMKNNLVDEYNKLAGLYDKNNMKEKALNIRQMLTKLKLI